MFVIYSSKINWNCVKKMDTKHQKYELNESIGEDELIRNLKVKKLEH